MKSGEYREPSNWSMVLLLGSLALIIGALCYFLLEDIEQLYGTLAYTTTIISGIGIFAMIHKSYQHERIRFWEWPVYGFLVLLFVASLVYASTSFVPVAIPFP